MSAFRPSLTQLLIDGRPGLSLGDPGTLLQRIDAQLPRVMTLEQQRRLREALLELAARRLQRRTWRVD